MFDSPLTAWNRIRTLLLLALAVGLLWFLLESLIYRSGFYYRHLAEPHSNAGAVVMRLGLAERQARAGMPTVLVFGDSRIGEGFSKPLAEAAAPGFNFISVGLPGSTPRAWYYLLRELVRRDLPFDIVVIGLLYQETMPTWPDWPLDPAFMAPLVDGRDMRVFPAGFSDAKVRWRAQQSIWLPALLMQKDTQALLSDPRARWRALQGKSWWFDNISDYQGNPNRMPDLEFSADGAVRDWGAASAEQKALIERHQNDLKRPPSAAVDAFSQHWLEQVLGLVRARGARLVIYPLPRGPYPQWLGPPQTSPALTALAAEPDVTLLPADYMAGLEAPQYFFDALHANQAGRRITSERVAAAVRDLPATGVSP